MLAKVRPLLVWISRDNAHNIARRRRRLDGLRAADRIGSGARPADLVHQTVEHRTAPKTGTDFRGIRYVYNGRFHTLRLRSLARLTTSRIGGRTFGDVVRSQFAAVNEATGVRTRFEITYGASGALAEVPIHIAYQPRWWFKVELFLYRRLRPRGSCRRADDLTVQVGSHQDVRHARKDGEVIGHALDRVDVRLEEREVLHEDPVDRVRAVD
jgi:hypothetical protein